MGFLIGGFIGGLRTVFGIAALAILIMPSGLNDNGQLLLCLMVGTIVSGFIITSYSSYKNVISQPQDGPAVLISVFAATFVAANAPPGLAVPIILATVAVSSILTGVIFFMIGHWKLGRFVRFIPYPVIGGFLAGSGLLIAISALSILMDQQLSAFNIDRFGSEDVKRVILGVMLAWILFKVPPFFKSRLVFPIILVVAALLVHLYFFYRQVPIADLQGGGWLLTPKQQNSSGGINAWFNIPADAWVILAGNSLTFLAVVIISVVAMLLNLSGLEAATRSEFDFDRELKVAGLSNIAGGMLGGAVNFPALSASLLGQQLKVNGRALGYITYGFILVFLLLGPEVLGYMPKPVLGALLLCIGIHLLDEWIVKGYRRFTRADYFTVVFIAITMIVAGYLLGVAAGIILCVGFFVWTSSNLKPITLELSGVELRSNVDRPVNEKGLLDRYGSEIRYLRIEGFVFFGTARAIYDRCKQLISEGGRFFILDMSQVKSIDSSAAVVLGRIAQFCQEHACVLQIARLNPALKGVIAVAQSGAGDFEFSADRDHAIAHCEERLLEKYRSLDQGEDRTPWAAISKYVENNDDFEKLKSFFVYRQCTKGEYIIRANEIGSEMFLIESGRFEVLIQPGGQETNEIRLRVMSVGAIFGEAVIYSSLKRTAAVRAEVDSAVYVLSKGRLEQLEQEFPKVGNVLHRVIVGMMSERLLAANRLIARLDS